MHSGDIEFLAPDNMAALVVVALLIIPLLYRILSRVGSHDLPPGPVGLPILGNLLQLRGMTPLTLKTLADKYGDIMYLRMGFVPTVVVSSYEKAVLFLKTHDAVFASRPVTAAGDVLFEGKALLMSPYGEFWRHMRKLCVREMLSPKKMEDFKPMRYEQVEALVSDLWENSSKGVKAVNMSAAFKDIISKVSLRMLSGRTYKGQALQLADGSILDFKSILKEAETALLQFNIGDFIPFLNVFDFQGVRRKAKQVRKELDYVFDKMIQDHLQNSLPVHAHADNAKDFVDVLLDVHHQDPVTFPLQNILCMMHDMYGAATETTSIPLEWAVREVARNPIVMLKLQQEIDTVVAQHGGKLDENSVEKAKYLNCVIKETLRLHPPLALGIPHKSTEAVTVDGFHVPAKTQVLFNLGAIGTDPRVWENAEKFDPERFMADECMDLSSLSSQHKVLPFSAGRRGCPGYAMAVPILRLCLAALFFAFDWSLSTPQQHDDAELLGTDFMLVPRLKHVSRLGLIHE